MVIENDLIMNTKYGFATKLLFGYDNSLKIKEIFYKIILNNIEIYIYESSI